LYKRKVGRQNSRTIGEHWRKWYYTAEVFVNNPTGRNKLVFSSEEAVYYISELINTGCYIQNLLTLYNLKFLPLGFLCN
jgi:hypothetical protein